MKNFSEADRLRKDVEVCLTSAENHLLTHDYRITAQQAQLCVEFSAKLVIACFEEPMWTYDPSSQLERIISQQKEEIAAKMVENFIMKLTELARSATWAAPWHGRTTYGRINPDGSRISASELCTKEVAQELINRAGDSFETARIFLEEWSRSSKR